MIYLCKLIQNPSRVRCYLLLPSRKTENSLSWDLFDLAHFQHTLDDSFSLCTFCQLQSFLHRSHVTGHSDNGHFYGREGCLWDQGLNWGGEVKDGGEGAGGEGARAGFPLGWRSPAAKYIWCQKIKNCWECEFLEILKNYRDIEVASIPNTALWTFPVLVPFHQIISRKNIINRMINKKTNTV